MKFNKRYANLVVVAGGRGGKKPSPNANAGKKEAKWDIFKINRIFSLLFSLLSQTLYIFIVKI